MDKSKLTSRKKFDDNYNFINELYKQGDKEQLAKEIRSWAKVINQRFVRLEKQGLAKGSYAYQMAGRELGRDKPRYKENLNSLNNMDIDTLVKYAREINIKLYSQTSSTAGMKSINKTKLTNATERLNYLMGGDYSISESEFNDFLKNGGAEMLNSKYLDSTQVIEDFIERTKSGQLSTKQFVSVYKSYSKQVDNSKRKQFNYTTLKNRIERKQRQNSAKQTTSRKIKYND